MLTKPSKVPLLAMLGSLLALIAALAWGAMFGFPEPDATPEKSAQLQLHAKLSGWFMLLAVIGFAASCLALLRGAFKAKRSGTP
jgi:hypothetical protein